jgi:branched-chain amino acid transport system permease protein
MLLFMIAAGMSIIFGLMNIINLAHGTFFALGAYIAFSFIHMHFGFWLSLIASIVIVMIIALILEHFLLVRVYKEHAEQVLLTFGIMFISADLMKWIWGADPLTVSPPPIFDSSINMGLIDFPVYRLFVIAVGIIVAFIMWYLENKTHTGAVIRAGVDDREMLGALGINVKVVFAGVFAFGAGIAALGGGLAGPILSLYLGMDAEVLILSLVIVVIGGLGTWKGSFVVAIMVGMIETLGQAWFPSISMAIVFIFMLVILIVKPSGLFGRGAQA